MLCESSLPLLILVYGNKHCESSLPLLILAYGNMLCESSLPLLILAYGNMLCESSLPLLILLILVYDNMLCENSLPLLILLILAYGNMLCESSLPLLIFTRPSSYRWKTNNGGLIRRMKNVYVKNVCPGKSISWQQLLWIQVDQKIPNLFVNQIPLNPLFDPAIKNTRNPLLLTQKSV